MMTSLAFAVECGVLTAFALGFVVGLVRRQWPLVAVSVLVVTAYTALVVHDAIQGVKS